MREIEVKARLRDKPVFLVAVQKLGIELSEPVHQRDRTFEGNFDYSDRVQDWTIFRLREQNGECTLTMKHPASDRPHDNFEFESLVSNPDDVAKMLTRLGYPLGVEVRKQRRTAQYKDYEICFDEVEELGLFVEIEKLAEDDVDVDEIQEELLVILEEFSLKREDRVMVGYDVLMHELKGAF